MEKVRPGTGREAGLGHVRREVFQSRTIRRELGVPPVTVSRQGCRRPSASGMSLQRVTGGTPSFRRIPWKRIL